MLVEGDEELGVNIDLLVEELNNVRSNVVGQEAHLKPLPKFDYEVVEVERVLIFLPFFVRMLGFRN